MRTRVHSLKSHISREVRAQEWAIGRASAHPERNVYIYTNTQRQPASEREYQPDTFDCIPSSFFRASPPPPIYISSRHIYPTYRWLRHTRVSDYTRLLLLSIHARNARSTGGQLLWCARAPLSLPPATTRSPRFFRRPVDFSITVFGCVSIFYPASITRLRVAACDELPATTTTACQLHVGGDLATNIWVDPWPSTVCRSRHDQSLDANFCALWGLFGLNV